ncbi:piercer of microtubule wall 2 protein-like [Branchiostoma floridae x Branchiostoma belcheri]
MAANGKQAVGSGAEQAKNVTEPIMVTENKDAEILPVRDLPCANPGNPIFSCMERIRTPKELGEWYRETPVKPQNPMYRTTNDTYGGRVPTVEDMPQTFHAKSQKFSEHLGVCGMYRNHSLNTALDQSKV